MSFWKKLFGDKGSGNSRHRIPTVKFDSSQVTDAIKVDLLNTIRDTDEIPAAFVEPVYAAALTMVMRGRDMYSFSKAVEDLKVNSLTKRDIGAIALYLANRSTALMEIQRFSDLGIVHAQWLYSGAPCTGSRKQDNLHKAANKTRFTVIDGLFLGVACWPGLERGCKCMMKPVIKGFS